MSQPSDGEPGDAFFSLSRVSDAGARYRHRNALNPAIWLCAVVGGPCFAILAVQREPHPVVPWLLVVVVASAVAGFLYLLFFDRDRLHSEEYLIRRQTLNIIEGKASKKAIDASLAPVVRSETFWNLPPAGGRAEGNP